MNTVKRKKRDNNEEIKLFLSLMNFATETFLWYSLNWSINELQIHPVTSFKLFNILTEHLTHNFLKSPFLQEFSRNGWWGMESWCSVSYCMDGKASRMDCIRYPWSVVDSGHLVRLVILGKASKKLPFERGCMKYLHISSASAET